MFNLMIGPISLLVLSILGMAVLLWREGRKLNWDKLAHADYPGLRVTVQEKINSAYSNFTLLFKQIRHLFYFYLLLVLRRLVIWFKIILILIEKRFSRLIDSIHGKGVVTKQGSVSFFLSSISKK